MRTARSPALAPRMPPGRQWLSQHCALPANAAPSTSPSISNLMCSSVFPHCGPLIAWRTLTEKMYWYQDFFSLFPFWMFLDKYGAEQGVLWRARCLCHCIRGHSQGEAMSMTNAVVKTPRHGKDQSSKRIPIPKIMPSLFQERANRSPMCFRTKRTTFLPELVTPSPLIHASVISHCSTPFTLTARASQDEGRQKQVSLAPGVVVEQYSTNFSSC